MSLGQRSVVSVLGKLLPWLGWIAALAVAVYEFLSKHPIPTIGVVI